MSTILQRRWFQFRLLTAVLVMLVTGSLLDFNTVETQCPHYSYMLLQGWPIAFRSRYHFPDPITRGPDPWLNASAAIADGIIAGGFLVCVIVISERRRRFRIPTVFTPSRVLIHPSTAVLVLCTFNLLLWLNLRLAPYEHADHVTVGFPCWSYTYLWDHGIWHWGGIALNVVTAAVILITVGFTLEVLVYGQRWTAAPRYT